MLAPAQKNHGSDDKDGDAADNDDGGEVNDDGDGAHDDATDDDDGVVDAAVAAAATVEDDSEDEADELDDSLDEARYTHSCTISLPFPIAPSPSRTSPLSYSLARSFVLSTARSSSITLTSTNNTRCVQL